LASEPAAEQQIRSAGVDSLQRMLSNFRRWWFPAFRGLAPRENQATAVLAKEGMTMFWQCNECGGLIDAVPRVSVCPECGTASSQIVAETSQNSDFSELREYWVQAGMAQERPVLTFEEVRHAE
jgi:hypothetical protein